MPDVATILSLAPGAGYLAGNNQDKGVLFNNSSRFNPLLPQQIYGIYFVAKKIYDNDPLYPGLVAVCNYLWEIMGRFGIAAQAITGGGGSVTPIVPITGYIYFSISDTITVASTTTYQNNDLKDGKDVTFIMVNDQVFQLSKGDFTIDYITGTITFLTITLFQDDTITIPFNKKF